MCILEVDYVSLLDELTDLLEPSIGVYYLDFSTRDAHRDQLVARLPIIMDELVGSPEISSLSNRFDSDVFAVTSAIMRLGTGIDAASLSKLTRHPFWDNFPQHGCYARTMELLHSDLALEGLEHIMKVYPSCDLWVTRIVDSVVDSLRSDKLPWDLSSSVAQEVLAIWSARMSSGTYPRRLR